MFDDFSSINMGFDNSMQEQMQEQIREMNEQVSRSSSFDTNDNFNSDISNDDSNAKRKTDVSKENQEEIKMDYSDAESRDFIKSMTSAFREIDDLSDHQFFSDFKDENGVIDFAKIVSMEADKDDIVSRLSQDLSKAEDYIKENKIDADPSAYDRLFKALSSDSIEKFLSTADQLDRKEEQAEKDAKIDQYKEKIEALQEKKQNQAYKGGTFYRFFDMQEKYYKAKIDRLSDAGGKEVAASTVDLIGSVVGFLRSNLLETFVLTIISKAVEIIKDQVDISKNSEVETAKPTAQTDDSEEDKVDKIDYDPNSIADDIGVKDNGIFQGDTRPLERDELNRIRSSNPNYGQFLGVDTVSYPGREVDINGDKGRVWTTGYQPHPATGRNVSTLRVFEIKGDYYLVNAFGKVEASSVANSTDKAPTFPRYFIRNCSGKDIEKMISAAKADVASKIENGWKGDLDNLSDKIFQTRVDIQHYTEKLSLLERAETHVTDKDRLTDIKEWKDKVSDTISQLERRVEGMENFRDTVKGFDGSKLSVDDKLKQVFNIEAKASGRAEDIESTLINGRDLDKSVDKSFAARIDSYLEKSDKAESASELVKDLKAYSIDLPEFLAREINVDDIQKHETEAADLIREAGKETDRDPKEFIDAIQDKNPDTDLSNLSNLVDRDPTKEQDPTEKKETQNDTEHPDHNDIDRQDLTDKPENQEQKDIEKQSSVDQDSKPDQIEKSENQALNDIEKSEDQSLKDIEKSSQPDQEPKPDPVEQSENQGSQDLDKTPTELEQKLDPTEKSEEKNPLDTDKMAPVGQEGKPDLSEKPEEKPEQQDTEQKNLDQEKEKPVDQDSNKDSGSGKVSSDEEKEDGRDERNPDINPSDEEYDPSVDKKDDDLDDRRVSDWDQVRAGADDDDAGYVDAAIQVDQEERDLPEGKNEEKENDSEVDRNQENDETGQNISRKDDDTDFSSDSPDSSRNDTDDILQSTDSVTNDNFDSIDDHSVKTGSLQDSIDLTSEGKDENNATRFEKLIDDIKDFIHGGDTEIADIAKEIMSMNTFDLLSVIAKSIGAEELSEKLDAVSDFLHEINQLTGTFKSDMVDAIFKNITGEEAASIDIDGFAGKLESIFDDLIGKLFDFSSSTIESAAVDFGNQNISVGEEGAYDMTGDVVDGFNDGATVNDFTDNVGNDTAEELDDIFDNLDFDAPFEMEEDIGTEIDPSLPEEIPTDTIGADAGSAVEAAEGAVETGESLASAVEGGEAIEGLEALIALL